MPVSALLLMQYAPSDEAGDSLAYNCYLCGTENVRCCADSFGCQLVLANVYNIKMPAIW